MATIPSTSAGVSTSGGEKPRMSPCGMARAIRPRLGCGAEARAPTLSAGSRALLAAPVGDELHRRHQADAAYLADQRVVGEGLAQGGLEVGAGARRVAGQVLALDDVERGVGGGSTQRMAGIGVAVAEGAELVRSLLQDPATFSPTITADSGT